MGEELLLSKDRKLFLSGEGNLDYWKAVVD